MNVIKKLRHEKMWTQSELADKAGINQRTVCKLERGTHRPQYETIIKLARALEVKKEVLAVLKPLVD